VNAELAAGKRRTYPVFHGLLTILVASTCCLVNCGRNRGWSSEVVGDASGTEQVCGTHDLAVAPDGTPHVVYFKPGENLDFARRNGTDWDVEVVDSAVGVGDNGVSLAFAHDGTPHLAYCIKVEPGAEGMRLRYARRSAGAWAIEQVDSSGSWGEGVCVILDAGGMPHLAYDDWSKRWLKYAWKDQVGWHVELVDSTNDGWYSNSPICFDGAGRVHIAYRRNDRLCYAVRESGVWTLEQVDDHRGDDEIGMALDADDMPHIAYGNGIDAGARPYYAYKDGSGWHIQQVRDFYAHSLSIALDSGGTVHVCYDEKIAGGTLKHAEYRGGVQRLLAEVYDYDGEYDPYFMNHVTVGPAGEVYASSGSWQGAILFFRLR